MERIATREATLYSAAAATENGAVLSCEGVGAIGVQLVNGSGTFTVTFRVSNDNSNWVDVPAFNMNTGVAATTATASGMYVVSVGGAKHFKAEITAASGCSLTGTAFLYEGAATDLFGADDLSALLTELKLKANLTETQPDSAASLPLPCSWGP